MKKIINLEDGTVAVFSSTKLKSAILRKKKALELDGIKISQQELLENIAEETQISFSTIKHWCAGHHAPSDVDKLMDLANALNIEMDYLLENEMEESAEMTNTNNDRYIHETDYSTTKSVIRSIYGSMSEHLEMFRLISAIESDTKALKLNFTKLYSGLMSARLDIPKPLFKELTDFASNYLQQLTYYLDYLYFMGTEDVVIDTAEEYIETYSNTYTFEPCAPWINRGKWIYVFIDADNKFCKAFEQAIAEQIRYQEDAEVIPAGENEIIIAAAYQHLEAILSEYMVG